MKTYFSRLSTDDQKGLHHYAQGCTSAELLAEFHVWVTVLHGYAKTLRVTDALLYSVVTAERCRTEALAALEIKAGLVA